MTRTLFFVFTLLMLGSFSSFGGNKKSIERKSKQEVILELDIQTYSDLVAVESKIESSPDESIQELDQIVKLAITENLEGSITFAYSLLGRAYKALHQPKLALHFMHLAEESYSSKQLGKLTDISPRYEIPAQYYLDLAEIHIQLGNYKTSNEQFEIYKNIDKNSLKTKKIDYQIAQNLYALENYKEAIVHYERLLKVETKENNELQKRICYSRLAACQISLGNTAEGLAFYNLSMPNQITAGIESSQFSQNKEIVTKALRKQNLTSEELSVRNSALSFVNDGLENLRLAQTYFRDSNLTKTELSLDRYFSNISYNLIDYNEIEVVKQMAIHLKNQQNNKKALEYYLNFDELSDTIKNRLSSLEQKSQELGEIGYQNILEIEVLQKDVEMSENTIYHLMREGDLKEDLVGFQKLLIISLCTLLAIGLASLIYIIRVSKQRRIANQQLALRSLRSQMNPHFIFNALNSVNSFISVSDEKSANKFLSEFSTLMRTVMENSEHDFISLNKELEIIKIYVELEHFRFQDKFSYKIDIDDDLDDEEIVLPTMLIQPYIENSIWHGLRYKESKGELLVSLKKSNKKLLVTIQDDGIGRKKSEQVKTKNQKKNKSTALKNIGERVELFKSLHNISLEVSINNLNDDGTGTVVSIVIPQPNND
ncbi:MAG: histidine kinase [Flavobacteriales bacterium]|nr:histidine kinase [Flavobacteriales bacterium]